MWAVRGTQAPLKQGPFNFWQVSAHLPKIITSTIRLERPKYRGWRSKRVQVSRVEKQRDRRSGLEALRTLRSWLIGEPSDVNHEGGRVRSAADWCTQR
eukprot:SAG11_NODE_1705_length_4412_cov_5.951078_4_plen_98_part_00